LKRGAWSGPSKNPCIRRQIEAIPLCKALEAGSCTYLLHAQNPKPTHHHHISFDEILQPKKKHWMEASIVIRKI
jgi:hypothetical protein